jgi:hypothetical protein
LDCYFGHHRSGSSYVRTILERLYTYQGLKTTTIHREDEISGLASTDLLILSNATLSSLQEFNFTRGFHIIRDPRDIVVSSYFSHLYSHSTRHWEELIAHRAFLESLTFDEGLTHELTSCRKQQFEDMALWNYDNPSILEIKFENLIIDPLIVWGSILDHLEIKTRHKSLLSNVLALHNKVIKSISVRRKSDVLKSLYIKHRLTQEEIQATLTSNSFENLSGKPKGLEDIQNHYRKGVSGDWKNHFTDTHKQLFKENWGELLFQLGYERDTNW